MDAAKLAVIAVGALVGTWAAAQARSHSPSKGTKHVPGRRAARGGQGRGTSTAVGAVATPAPAPVTLSSHPLDEPLVPAPALDAAAYLLLLLQALLSLAAVLYADRVRPAGYGVQEWQQLVAAASVAATAVHLAAAAFAAWLRHSRCRTASAAVAADAAAAAPAAMEQAGMPLQDLSGTWIKDKAASDSMDPSCDAMRLGAIMRTAIRLICGLELEMDDQQFHMSVLSGILWFKVTERYPLSGEATQWRRRDLRRGKHVGRVERCPSSGGMVVRLEWGDPLGGTAVDQFTLVQPDVLHVRTDLVVGELRVSYTQVYRRKT